MFIEWINEWNWFVFLANWFVFLVSSFLQEWGMEDTESWLVGLSEVHSHLASLKQLRHCWPRPSVLKSCCPWPPQDVFCWICFCSGFSSSSSLIVPQFYIQFSYFPTHLGDLSHEVLQLPLYSETRCLSLALHLPPPTSVLSANRWTFFKYPSHVASQNFQQLLIFYRRESKFFMVASEALPASSLAHI